VPSSTPFQVTADGGEPPLEAQIDGDGASVVCLHGLTATRRYVLMGSRLLARGGFRVVAYDARGHGESGPPADRTAYEYEDLVADLERVLDACAIDRTVLVGGSMGAATAMAFALRHPDRVAALVQITPAYPGYPLPAGAERAAWDALADGLERDGVDGFMAAYRPGSDPRWAQRVLAFTRQRLERHRDPDAVAHALRIVPRSPAFDGLDALRTISAPSLIVATRDDTDPAHPVAVARAYAEHLPDVRLVVDEPGAAPLAWRGAQLSRAVQGFLREVGYS